VADHKAVAALVDRAKSFEKGGRWKEARVVYEKLGKTNGYSLGEALYHQAYAALMQNATEDALNLAREAAHQPGPFKTSAMFLYSDAWYRQGEFLHAKELYITIRKSVVGDDRATATKKVAACNKALNLPEADGVVD
jgi:tetratricopeptide (TPR) repeat protein